MIRTGECNRLHEGSDLRSKASGFVSHGERQTAVRLNANFLFMTRALSWAWQALSFSWLQQMPDFRASSFPRHCSRGLGLHPMPLLMPMHSLVKLTCDKRVAGIKSTGEMLR
jgi:hypothetical protein